LCNVFLNVSVSRNPLGGLYIASPVVTVIVLLLLVSSSPGRKDIHTAKTVCSWHNNFNIITLRFSGFDPSST
jgi:hypothetical protein